MKRVLASAFVLILVSLVLLQSSHAAKKVTNEEQEVLNLEDQWANASLKNDASALEKILAEDYVNIVPDGSIQGKEDDLRDAKAGDLKFAELKLQDVKVRIYGKTAIVTSIALVNGSYKGTDISGKYRGTDVIVRRNGEWKIVSTQGTKISK